MIRILVQEQDFDAGAEIALLSGDGVGGIGSFIGTVRSNGDIAALYLEHYPAMTERAMTKIAGEAAARWPLKHCTIIHRVGKLLPGENIVFVGASSAHRQAAFNATAFLIDWMKTSAPFWKREEFLSGHSEWVATREVDTQAAKAWERKD